MIDPHNKENALLLMATQVINLLGFTETTSQKHPNQSEIYIKIQISALFLRELPGLPCIFSHCNAIGNVLSLDIQYHS